MRRVLLSPGTSYGPLRQTGRGKMHSPSYYLFARLVTYTARDQGFHIQAPSIVCNSWNPFLLQPWMTRRNGKPCGTSFKGTTRSILLQRRLIPISERPPATAI